ncbi:MAG TPA: hypothetical protein VLR52_06215, partial [Bacteroidales bacterium]|nr:hypothetical protein [Bacteroidales bacterium]
MRKYQNDSLPGIPEQIPVLSIPDIKMSNTVDFFEWKKTLKPVVNETPLTFESLGQGQGYVLYAKHFRQPVKGKLQINGLRDYALVYVNGRKVGELNRVLKIYSLDITIPVNGDLEILVENMGRINYGAEIPDNQKGIILPVMINNDEINGNWEMYKIPMEFVPSLKNIHVTEITGRPAFYSG